MRFLALFGVLIGEGAMVIYLAPPIKKGLLSVLHRTRPIQNSFHPDFRVHRAATTGVFGGVLD